MSFKNILQELYQKQKLPLPKYETVRLGGRDHRPVFVSKITLFDGQIVEGDQETTKRSSELNAAEKALQLVNPVKNIEPRDFNLKRRVGIFIDIENKPIIEDILNIVGVSTKIHIYAFASEEHPSLIKVKNKDFDMENFQLIEVPTTRKDGADIGLMLFVGGLLFKKSYKDFIIVTGDHYGDALADCVQGINKMYDWGSSNPRIHCCRTFDKVIQNLVDYEG